MRKFIQKKISVVIPTFNEENNIVTLINEIIDELNNKDYEIIIVDDGSTDATVSNILDKFKDHKNIDNTTEDCFKV